MDPNSYEQYQADAAAVGDASKWLKEEVQCSVTLYNNVIIQVTPPMFVELEVIETEPGIRGDTAGTGGKTAKLETGDRRARAALRTTGRKAQARHPNRRVCRAG